MKKNKYKKNFRTKKKKSILKNKFFWSCFFIFFIFSGTFYFFVFSSFFQIKEIQVLGAEKISEQEIKEIISLNSGNIFLTNFKKLNQIILERYIQIAGINFKRKFPGRLVVQVSERRPELVFCDSECFFVDVEGVAFEKVSEISSNMLVVRAENVNKERLGQVIKIKSGLKIPIEEILIVSDKRFNVKTSEGWQIYFDPREKLDRHIEELDILLKEKLPFEKRKHLEYIDLRFEKIFIYPETQ